MKFTREQIRRIIQEEEQKKKEMSLLEQEKYKLNREMQHFLNS